MARFLFVMVPIVARVWPAVAIADALTTLGHQVAWCGPEGDLRPLVGPDVTIYPTGKRSYRALDEVGMAAVRQLWDGYLLPLNGFIQAPVEQAVAQYRPDVVFADQYAICAAIAAAKHDVRWATLATGALELTPPARLPGVPEWVRSRLAQLTESAGLAHDDLLFSPDLVIATTSRALTGDAAIPPQCVLVGAALGPRRTDPTFPWDRWDGGRRHVLVTVGTLWAHMVDDFVARMTVALRPLASTVHAVFNFPETVLPDPPAHILVVPRIPMLELMPRLDAVVCQAGQSTVNEALLNGVPLVVAPIRLGELPVAEQVVRAGAGVEVSLADATPTELTAAMTAVLDEPAYRRRARRIGAEFAAAGGTETAAAHLVALAAGSA